MRRRDFIIACSCALCAGPALARGSTLVESHMRFVPTGGEQVVAVTLDACMGQTDERILGALIDNQIAATIFATGLWLASNPETIKTLLAHPDLFQVQNHGARHLAAVLGTDHPYGIEPVGTVDGLFAEVIGGSQAVGAAFAQAPKWYRDATAEYSPAAFGMIEAMGLKVAGFSLNGDLGASVSAETATARISGAVSGDVIISHINHPSRPAGEGVAAGLLALKARGFAFVHLDDVAMVAA